MPEPVRGDQRYLPGLDGLRALAVAAVVAYHLDLGWAQGGLLGVGVFFTLSGYLITDILLGQWDRAGRLRLSDFWLGRARRLLPALIVMLIVVAIWMAVANATQLPGLRGDVVAAALYASNWWYIGEHTSYYAQFSPPTPLDHLWSLAVEEQFYLVWPWLLLLGLLGVGALRRRRGSTASGSASAGPDARRLRLGARCGLAIAAIAIATVSAVAMSLLYHPGHDPTRVYEGTDTRAFGLLIGAALAMVWPTGRKRPSAAVSWTLDAAGAAGLVVILVLVWRTNEYSAFLFRGGLVLLSAATALVVAAVATPGSRFGRVLGCGPLRWLGVRSYGIYLWHYPVIVLTAPPLGGMTGVRAVAVTAGSVAIAALSWRFVEEPIRRGSALSRLPLALQRKRFVPVLAGAGLCLAVFASVAATIVPQARRPAAAAAGSAMQPPPASAAARGQNGIVDANPGAVSAGGAQTAEGTPGQAGLAGLRTSCRSVVHIGDSTSEGLISANYLPNPAQRITARYAQIGVTREYMKVSGGTSIVETMPGTINAYQVAKQFVASGYRGCWVIALGTNDTADVAIGSNVGLAARIKRMMSVIGNQPVLWVNDKSLLTSGPYSEQNMLQWDKALAAEEPHHPNMRVYNWAAVVRNSWFINDGIHFTSQGYAERALLIAETLARAFPAKPAVSAGAPARAPARASAPADAHQPAAGRP
jgi:peptidoglycan/LPS O-acetylase OafA/YrhL